MRGKASHSRVSAARCRITPAYAGKRLADGHFHCEKWDHPRVCGEKAYKRVMRSSLWGSPPRMRGKGPAACPRPSCSRITPAYAGKRLKRSRSTVPPAAIVLPFPSVCNRPAGSGGNPAERDAPPFLPIENAAPASPAYNLRSL